MGVFGSRARARILGFLAQSSAPQTGYSIAKNLAIGPSNAYPELDRLVEWGIIVGRLDVRGNRVFEMADDDLRRFLLRRVRIISSEDWFSPERLARRGAQSREAEKIAIKVPKVRVKERNRPLKEEFQRPAEKDRVLKRIRARPGAIP